ncbi:MAG: hypothetical protein ABIJ09_20820 [Pseudomonadota bacterium]
MRALAATLGLVVLLAACREAGDLPNPFTDAGIYDAGGDAGPVPDGAIGAPCPTNGCHPSLSEVLEADGGCVCRRPCQPAQPVPRCVDWEICAQLRQVLPDGGSRAIDAGVCLPAAAPDETCSPTPCAEMLLCARIAQRDAGNTCRYPCRPSADAAVEDADGVDARPLSGTCPAGQRCFAMPGDAGACFLP